MKEKMSRTVSILGILLIALMLCTGIVNAQCCGSAACSDKKGDSAQSSSSTQSDTKDQTVQPQEQSATTTQTPPEKTEGGQAPAQEN